MIRLNIKFYNIIVIYFYYITLTSANLCNYLSFIKYNDLKSKYPEHSSKFEVLSNIPLPIWVTDRDSNSFNNVQNALLNCKDLTNILIIYALPNKDCEAGFSSSGENKNENDYINYISSLGKIVNNNKIIYIFEPDAIALSLNNKCGIENNYINNIKKAVDILSTNLNAEIYIDIGYWVLLYNDNNIDLIINILNDMNKKIKGISINLSNYQTNKQMEEICNKLYQKSNKKYTCIIDTSRNWNGPSENNQWCNLISAGMGELPTVKPLEYVDYYLWLKPQYELDGPCIGFQNSYQVNKNAGDIDINYFLKLWENGNPKLKSCI